MKSISAADRVKLDATKLQKLARQEFTQGNALEQSTGTLRALIVRFRALRGWHSLDDSSIASRLAVVTTTKCLELLALEAGHDSWSQYASVLRGPSNDDEATELYVPNNSEFNLNVWCRSYAEARTYLDTHSGFYLLQYQGSCFLAQEGHIWGLGLDPTDPDWEQIGWDWVRPKNAEAKDRLRQKLRLHRENSQPISR